MARPRAPQLIKLFCGLLSGDVDLLQRARQLLRRRLGPTDLVSEIWPFEQTDYYAEEMGPDLKRQFVSFARPTPPDALAGTKHETNAIEEDIVILGTSREITTIKISDKTYPFGGACNRYTNIRQNLKYDVKELDLVALRQKLMYEKYASLPPQSSATDNKPPQKTIGINKSLYTETLYPLYYNFFTKLGLQVVLPEHICSHLQLFFLLSLSLFDIHRLCLKFHFEKILF